MTAIFLGSLLIGLYSLSMLIPLFVGFWYGEGMVWPFLETFVLTLALGSGGVLVSYRHKTNLKHRDGFIVIIAFWLLMSLASALPFALSNELDLHWIDALFEGVSGITTTGASILADIDATPRSFLYYRAQLNYLGGLGVVILAIALLPMTGIGGAKLYQSEAPGPSKDERIMPRMADTARNLWVIYLALGLACVLAYKAAGMAWFDAICHSLSTVSLGGFSTHGDSLGYYSSARIEAVAGFFSLLAALNFGLYYASWHHKSLAPLKENPEVRIFLLVCVSLSLFTILYLIGSGTFAWPDAIHHGFFQSISVLTDNGLGTAQYPNWPVPIAMVLILSSFFGGCVGSTCGGIKAMRFLLLLRQVQQYIFQSVHPNAVFVVKYHNKKIEPGILQAVWAFFFAYIMIACLFVVALVICGEDPLSAFGTTAACLNNMGIGYGTTAGGFSDLQESSKLIMCVAMLCGRLEIFPILIVLSRTFWRF